MKLPIRFADQIVGALIVLALGIVIFVIFMLGSSQRWFSRDYEFKTYFPSATGLSQNMAVQYKGFNIGRVKSIKLSEDDQVEVRFIIFDTYIDRVRQGSLVEVVVSPIGALGGSQFLFHPGPGAMLMNEGDIIPIRTLEASKDLNDIINEVGELLVLLNTAMKGSEETTLGRIVGNVEKITGDLQPLPGDIVHILDSLVADIEPILNDFKVFTDSVTDPSSSVASILSPEGAVYMELVTSLEALSGTLRNLERTSDFLPAQVPLLQNTLNSVDDVLSSLTNNPLLRPGIPGRTETVTGGTHGRNEVDFGRNEQ